MRAFVYVCIATGNRVENLAKAKISMGEGGVVVSYRGRKTSGKTVGTSYPFEYSFRPAEEVLDRLRSWNKQPPFFMKEGAMEDCAKKVSNRINAWLKETAGRALTSGSFRVSFSNRIMPLVQDRKMIFDEYRHLLDHTVERGMSTYRREPTLERNDGKRHQKEEENAERESRSTRAILQSCQEILSKRKKDPSERQRSARAEKTMQERRGGKGCRRVGVSRVDKRMSQVPTTEGAREGNPANEPSPPLTPEERIKEIEGTAKVLAQTLFALLSNPTPEFRAWVEKVNLKVTDVEPFRKSRVDNHVSLLTLVRAKAWAKTYQRAHIADYYLNGERLRSRADWEEVNRPLQDNPRPTRPTYSPDDGGRLRCARCMGWKHVAKNCRSRNMSFQFREALKKHPNNVEAAAEEVARARGTRSSTPEKVTNEEERS